MTLLELARKNRSTRRFRQDVRLSRKQLMEFIEAARLAPCGANLQLLRFTPIYGKDKCGLIFPSIKWAAYLRDWNGPGEDERPSGYIIIHMPREERRHLLVDAGIAAAYIVLSARESGFGSCMVMSFDRSRIEDVIGSPEGYIPFLVIALGIPGEEVILEESEGSVEYYRDDRGVHHVPKLPLEELLTD